jgi:hypothetical protein
LAVDDIHYAPGHPAERPASRLTLHHFADLSRDPYFRLIASPNLDARQPQDTDQWPPALILDFVYGYAALKAWGPATFVDLVRKSTRDAYYDHTDTDESDVDRSFSPQPINAKRKQENDRDARAAARSKRKHMGQLSREDDLMDVVMALWKRAARKGRPQQQVDPASGAQGSRDRVQAWLGSVE